MNKGLITALVMFFSLSAEAGNIAKVFADGIFGVEWGATIAEVKGVYPDGSTKEYLGIKNYIVPHDKSVLNISRKGTDVTFTFNSLGQLHAVGVSFAGNEYLDVYNALKTYFGDHEDISNSPKVSWPLDEGIKMYLVSLPSGFSIKPVLTIENVSSNAPVDKDKLGF
ncbi:hypothetical protein [Alteromonas stellipolaris]|uniref:hypothetical protein n=1 Tax=Alteromonas stellipolaris TaxID=233316 RepID=UPI001D8B4596|nr:hypothetical protein [Alteromonas stellipolaris]MBZ2163220.1 hypothetical protein [Alteromonas stellipolaris]